MPVKDAPVGRAKLPVTKRTPVPVKLEDTLPVGVPAAVPEIEPLEKVG